MQYDPIKHRLSGFIRNQPILKILFFKILRTIFLREWYVRALVRSLFSHERPKRILDAGCGFGQYSYFMATNNPTASIDAVDLNPSHVDALGTFAGQLTLPVTTAVADLTKLNQPDTYDFVLCVDVIEHIEDDRAVFSNFFTSMKRGGRLVISTPSDQGGSDHHHDHHDDDHEHSVGAHGFIDEHARDGYSVFDLTEKLKTAGFTVEDVRFTYGLAGQWSWRMAVKWPILMLNASMAFILILPFYYLVTIVPILLLHWVDTLIHWKSGTGLIAHAVKP